MDNIWKVFLLFIVNPILLLCMRLFERRDRSSVNLIDDEWIEVFVNLDKIVICINSDMPILSMISLKRPITK